MGCRHLRQLKKQAAFCRKPPRSATTRLPGLPAIHLQAKFAEWNIQPLGHAGDGFDHRKIFLFLDGRQRLPRHMREFVKLVERQPALFAQFAENRRQRQNGQGRMVAIHARTISNSRLLIFHTSRFALPSKTHSALGLDHFQHRFAVRLNYFTFSTTNILTGMLVETISRPS